MPLRLFQKCASATGWALEVGGLQAVQECLRVWKGEAGERRRDPGVGSKSQWLRNKASQRQAAKLYESLFKHDFPLSTLVFAEADQLVV